MSTQNGQLRCLDEYDESVWMSALPCLSLTLEWLSAKSWWTAQPPVNGSSPISHPQVTRFHLLHWSGKRFPGGRFDCTKHNHMFMIRTYPDDENRQVLNYTGSYAKSRKSRHTCKKIYVFAYTKCITVAMALRHTHTGGWSATGCD